MLMIHQKQVECASARNRSGSRQGSHSQGALRDHGQPAAATAHRCCALLLVVCIGTAAVATAIQVQQVTSHRQGPLCRVAQQQRSPVQLVQGRAPLFVCCRASTRGNTRKEAGDNAARITPSI